MLSTCPQRVGFKRYNMRKREGHYERDCPLTKRVGSQAQQSASLIKGEVSNLRRRAVYIRYQG